MTELLTAAQMRAIEQAAIDSGEVTGLELMERAGRGVVEAIFEEWPELAKTDHRAVVLCGPGNNGGDGFVVARLLKEWGWDVEVFLYGDAEKLPPDAQVNYERWGEMGEVGDLENAHIELPNCDVFIDALFGTGLSRGLPVSIEPIWRALGDAMVEGVPRLVSVDIASGICADSGRNIGDYFFYSDLTVSFHRAKAGHYIDLVALADKIVVADIGIESRHPKYAWETEKLLHLLKNVYEDDDPWGVNPHDLLKTPLDHKYDHGNALILSGGVGKGGAARLAARGALRIGAGVVTVGCPPGALQENAGALDAVMVRALKGGEGLVEALGDARINALCLGPGLGTERAAEMVAVVLGDAADGGRSRVEPGMTDASPGMTEASPGKTDESPGMTERGLVLDADALTALAADARLFGKLHENCVLTPHAGEFARLFPDIAEKLNAPATKGPAYSKVDATREAAARAGCVVLFKGADTVIAAPDGRCSINSAHYERSAPWLATAGSGDVLAGFITGLLARGFAPMQAAETGAWLHVECALKFGPGLIAEDLPEQLPTVFRDLGV